MQKIVINATFGGFSLSEEEVAEYNRRTGRGITTDDADDIERDDPVLVQLVEEMGKGANGEDPELRVVEIHDGVEWQIEEYDGKEWVAEKHRTWC